MTLARRAVALTMTTTLAGGLLVFDVVGGSTPSPVAPQVTTLALASQRVLSPTGLPVASAAPSTAVSEPAGDADVGDDTTAVITTAPIEADDFTVVGVTWAPGDDPAAVQVRVRGDDGWSAWTLLEPLEAGPDLGTEEAALAAGITGTEPLVTDGADALQVRVESTGPSIPDSMSAALVDPGTSPADGVEVTQGPLSGASADLLRPRIVSRAGWGADESLRSCSPSFSSTLDAATVHHTAGTNAYSASAAPAVVRGIYAYHTKSLGWCDVGYNALVDRFGTVYEGRAGGLSRAVRGAHSGGFNDRTFGVAAIGNYETAAAPEVMVRAIGQVIGWKLSLFGRQAGSTATLTSAGGGTSRYPAGQRVTLPRVFAHRDVGRTACPGLNLFQQMGTIRAAAALYGGDLAPTSRLVPVEADGTPGSELLTYDSASGLQRVLDVLPSGRTAPLATARWMAGWTHVVAVEADGTPGDEVLVYNRATGRQALLDLDGGRARTLSSAQWSPGWTHVVPLEADGAAGSEIMVYSSVTGRQQLLSLADGRVRTLSKADWSPGWSKLVAVETAGKTTSDLIVYNAVSGRQQLLALASGRPRTLSKVDWSPGWTHLLAVEADGTAGSEVLVYSAASGRQAVLDVAGGRFRTVLTGTWAKGWTEVLDVEVDRTVGSEILLYQAATRQAVFLDMSVEHGIRTLAQP